jgi:hypothetical protein
MLSIISGAVVLGAGGTGIWYFKPRGNKPHRLATAPLLDAFIPICIVALLALGIALIVSGAASL